MAEYNNFYQKAIYYDIVFGRDVSREVDFLMEVFRQLTGREAQSLLDLACGPGYHARNFARRGLRAVGLDLRREMINFAHQSAQKDGVSVDWITADMRYVELDEPIDMAVNMFDGIDCLNNNTDLVQHLKTMAYNLTPGGLYLIDNIHPRDVGYTCYNLYHYGGEKDGVKVDIEWAKNRPQIDPINGVFLTEIEVRVNDHGQEVIFQDSACERILTAQEICLLAELSGVFEPIAWYGDYDINQPYDSSPASHRMIAVLRKR